MKQSGLFTNDQIEAVSLAEAAALLKVSLASVRNWIKTGYLQAHTKQAVTLASLLHFKHEVLGTEKLMQRANKSRKDAHDHGSLQAQIRSSIKTAAVTPDRLSDLYEANLSESYRNQEGVFYTPHEVTESFFEYLPQDCSQLTFCDPCCGTGNFLVAALQRGFKPENIFGYDIDPVALEIARRRLMECQGGQAVNLEQRDFLNEPKRSDEAYAVIVTNPPWGKKLPKSERDALTASVTKGASKDSSVLFFMACLQVLDEQGYLGFLLPEAFFNIASYELVRKTALQYEIMSLVDFGRPFKGVLTKANGIVLCKRQPKKHNTIICVTQTGKERIRQATFAENPKSIFNFSCTAQDQAVIAHTLSMAHQTLHQHALWGLGIVTGSNKKFCRSEPQVAYIPVFKGADISKQGLKTPTQYIPQDLSQYQQVAPLELYQAPEKLIYKFISSELVFFHDTQQRYILNSANMLVVKKSLGISHEQLCDLLNSKFMSWFFKKVFDTRKILKADLEYLPIFTAYFEQHRDFDETDFLRFLSLEPVSDEGYRIKK